MMNFFYKNMKNKKGFTLIELIVVIAILGILAAVAIPSYSGFQEKAKVSTNDANLKTIASAIQVYNAEKGAYPKTAGEMTTCVTTYLNGEVPGVQATTTPAHADTDVFVMTISNGSVVIKAPADIDADTELQVKK